MGWLSHGVLLLAAPWTRWSSRGEHVEMFWRVVHVLAAIGAIGPEAAFGLMGPAARRRGREAALAVYTSIAEARVRVVYPALALQVVSGTILIVTRQWSILGEGWLFLSLVLYGLALAIVVAVLAPTSARFRENLAQGMEPDDPRLRGQVGRLGAGGAVAGTFLLVVAVLMVWKPF